MFFVAGYLLLEPEHFRQYLFTRKLPLPINVESRNVGSVIATDHAIDIHHGYDSKLILIPQFLSLERIRSQKRDQPFHDIRRRGLPWMLPTYDVNNRLLLFLGTLVRDVKDRYRIVHSRHA